MAVVDDVFANPAAIIEAVATTARFSPPQRGGSGYPGHQAAAPSVYARALLAAADEALGAIFVSKNGAIGGITCSFSLASQPVAELHPLQTVPHIDIAEPDRFAILHYLCGEPFGGTAFYRQDCTGFEQVTRGAWHEYVAARDVSLAAHGAHGYPSATTTGYTCTASLPARMNRMLVYRSHSLHSGVIPEDVHHLADPRRGRLTGNLFAIYRT